MAGRPEDGHWNRLHLVHRWLGSCRVSVLNSVDGYCPVHHWSWGWLRDDGNESPLLDVWISGMINFAHDVALNRSHLSTSQNFHRPRYGVA